MKTLRLVVVAALLAQTGAVVAAAQSFAWLSMLGRGQSVSSTFDGKHPCALCRKIEKVQSGPSLAAHAAGPAVDWIAPPAAPVTAAPHARRVEPPVAPLFASFAASPATPPPRAFLA